MTILDYAPDNATVILDLGFDGARSLYPNIKIVIPTKKPKNKDLTDIQKAANSIVSSRRVIVEHIIAHVKAFYILKNEYRGNIKLADKAFKVCCKLYNFRLTP